MDEINQDIIDYVQSRMLALDGEQKQAIYEEFKEWLENKNFDQDKVWSIPDLTDDGLCDFFRRAISQK